METKEGWTITDGFKPPFRVGRKLKRAIVDSNGRELQTFNEGLEYLAQMVCDMLNGEEAQQREELVKGVLEMEDVKAYTGLRDLKGNRIYRGDVVENEVGERGVVMYWDGSFCVAYFDEPAKEYFHSIIVMDKDYCSTGIVKLTKLNQSI